MAYRITVSGPSPETIIDRINSELRDTEKLCNSLAKSSRDKMKIAIKSNQKRSGNSGELSKSIRLHKTEITNEILWGVGKISNLPEYWYTANYGVYFNTGKRYSPPPVRGFFSEGIAPDGKLRGKGAESFTPSSDGYYMKPGPVRPLRYIEPTTYWLEKAFNNGLNRILLRK